MNIEEIRKMINDEYHKAQEFKEHSSTYPDRMRTPYYKDAIIQGLRQFCNILDQKLKDTSLEKNEGDKE